MYAIRYRSRARDVKLLSTRVSNTIFCVYVVCGKMLRGLLKNVSKVFSFGSGAYKRCQAILVLINQLLVILFIGNQDAFGSANDRKRKIVLVWYYWQ